MARGWEFYRVPALEVVAKGRGRNRDDINRPVVLLSVPFPLDKNLLALCKVAFDSVFDVTVPQPHAFPLDVGLQFRELLVSLRFGLLGSFDASFLLGPLIPKLFLLLLCLGLFVLKVLCCVLC